MSAERKILVVPAQQSGRVLQQLRLPHPRTGAPASYYADVEGEVLLEAATVDMSGRRSWLGDGWVSADGSASLLTPIDPLFVYLALITTMSMDSGDDEWKYVDVDSLRLETNDTMDAVSVTVLLSMSTVRTRALNALCDIRDVSSDMQVAKIDSAKVLAWLKRKCDPSRFPKALESSVVDAAVAVSAELAAQARQREMALLVSEYLSQHWTTRLFAEFGGFAQVSESEQLLVKRVQAVAFDSPDSYVQGVASPNAGSKLAVKQEKPKTAKEKQLEKAAQKAKSITSFFKKKEPSM
ncbi:hypothetical protein GGF44_000569 [Coemansia sp. RSA 1694]|nr:hypothetical protein GGF44_000569 [Coemansia sp. RSA 1694]